MVSPDQKLLRESFFQLQNSNPHLEVFHRTLKMLCRVPTGFLYGCMLLLIYVVRNVQLTSELVWVMVTHSSETPTALLLLRAVL